MIEIEPIPVEVVREFNEQKDEKVTRERKQASSVKTDMKDSKVVRTNISTQDKI